MKSEGYIGVSVNPKKRFKNHKETSLKKIHQNKHLQRAFKKYGDSIIQHIIWVGKEDNCYLNEETLRPKKYIGWNIDKGGGKPPSQKGKSSWCTGTKGVVKSNKGSFQKGHQAWNKELTKMDVRVARGAEKISKKHIGRHWYTNGSIDVTQYSCPVDFWPGRSNMPLLSKETLEKRKNNPKTKGWSHSMEHRAARSLWMRGNRNGRRSIQ
jgi:hypothetical protein